ncbi:Gfo/Idh/MocA family oxidoreductase [Paenibacillus sp. GYB004]|uniref:Gfo/Idh/MocA family protein n=1 Tax=Paenibacillus sp. GYB004 TaxID=2994393 RepID=UPI002F961919
MKQRIGFIGSGNFTDKHQKLLARMDGVEVVGFCGKSMERAEQAARNWPNAKAYRTAEQMMESAELDALYICVPPMAHGELERSAAERGIPFLVEKPLGIDPAPLRPVRDLVVRSQLVTSVGYNWRYLDSVTRARERLQQATTGLALGYWMGTMPKTPWWRRMQGSGGQFMEQSTHVVDLVRYLCGEITEVYAVYGNVHVHRTLEDMDVPDVGTVTMKLAGGIAATISNTCMLPRGHTNGLDVYTSEGVLEIRFTGLKEIGRDRTTEYRNLTDPYVQENTAFLHAVRTGDRSLIRSDYADAFRTFEATAAANVSAREGRPVRLNGSDGDPQLDS